MNKVICYKYIQDEAHEILLQLAKKGLPTVVRAAILAVATFNNTVAGTCQFMEQRNNEKEEKPAQPEPADTIPCLSCGGTGRVEPQPDPDEPKCLHNKQKRTVAVFEEHADDKTNPCPDCEGSGMESWDEGEGYQAQNECLTCKGTGILHAPETARAQKARVEGVCAQCGNIKDTLDENDFCSEDCKRQAQRDFADQEEGEAQADITRKYSGAE